jgi:hypothetical protein
MILPVFLESLKESGHLEEIGVDGRIIFKNVRSFTFMPPHTFMTECFGTGTALGLILWYVN